MRELHIGKNDAGRRLDRVVHAAFPNLPTTVAIKAIRTKNIKRNGKRCEPGDRLEEGDVLALYLPDDLLERPAVAAAPADLPAPDILYEDANILLVEKPQGLVVHEDDRGTQDTLIARIQSHLIRTGEYDPAAENTFAPALANRIDRIPAASLSPQRMPRRFASCRIRFATARSTNITSVPFSAVPCPTAVR